MTSTIFELHDGRELCWEELADPHGRPHVPLAEQQDAILKSVESA